MPRSVAWRANDRERDAACHGRPRRLARPSVTCSSPFCVWSLRASASAAARRSASSDALHSFAEDAAPSVSTRCPRAATCTAPQTQVRSAVLSCVGGRSRLGRSRLGRSRLGRSRLGRSRLVRSHLSGQRSVLFAQTGDRFRRRARLGLAPPRGRLRLFESLAQLARAPAATDFTDSFVDGVRWPDLTSLSRGARARYRTGRATWQVVPDMLHPTYVCCTLHAESSAVSGVRVSSGLSKRRARTAGAS